MAPTLGARVYVEKGGGRPRRVARRHSEGVEGAPGKPPQCVGKGGGDGALWDRDYFFKMLYVHDEGTEPSRSWIVFLKISITY